MTHQDKKTNDDSEIAEEAPLSLTKWFGCNIAAAPGCSRFMSATDGVGTEIVADCLSV